VQVLQDDMQPQLLEDWLTAYALRIQNYHGKGSCLLAAMMQIDAADDAGIESLQKLRRQMPRWVGYLRY
jgi:hypothetical protein